MDATRHAASRARPPAPTRREDARLAGPRVILRPFLAEDAAGIAAAAAEEASSPSGPAEWPLGGCSEREAEAWLGTLEEQWASGARYDFAVILRQDGRLAGGCALNQLSAANLSANLAYWVRRSLRGQGLAPEAIRLVAGFAFSALGLWRVELAVATDNTPSMRAAEKAGAVFEGVARSRLALGGSRRDAAIYSILPGDIIPAADPARPVADSGL